IQAGAPQDLVDTIVRAAMGPTTTPSIDLYRVGIDRLMQLERLYNFEDALQSAYGIPADQIDNVIRNGMHKNPANPSLGVFDRAYRYRRAKYEKLLRELNMTPQPAAAGAGKGAGRRHGWWDDDNARATFEKVSPWLTNEQRQTLINNPEAAAGEVTEALN